MAVWLAVYGYMAIWPCRWQWRWVWVMGYGVGVGVGVGYSCMVLVPIYSALGLVGTPGVTWPTTTHMNMRMGWHPCAYVYIYIYVRTYVYNHIRQEQKPGLHVQYRIYWRTALHLFIWTLTPSQPGQQNLRASLNRSKIKRLAGINPFSWWKMKKKKNSKLPPSCILAICNPNCYQQFAILLPQNYRYKALKFRRICLFSCAIRLCAKFMA